MTQPVTINRGLVGCLALGCLIGAAASFVYETEEVNVWQSAFTRVGIVMTALWMALPRDGRLGSWANVSLSTIIGIVGAIFFVSNKPKQLLTILPILLGVAAIGFFLRPREKQRPPREQ